MKPLTPEEKHVIIDKGTEMPYSGKYYKHVEAGTYICRQCGAELYRSYDKFDAHCGWPSFDDALPGAILQTLDLDKVRTEITCANCGGHLGHVFTGEHITDKNTRYCVNSLSLDFMPIESENKKIMSNANTQKDIILAGGCFWCIEAALRQKEGVLDVVSGYVGGTIQNPTYEDVYTERAGAREACLVIYDGDKVSTKEIIQYFFSVIDPTDPDGQFADRGYSYTTAIYYNSQEEKKLQHVLVELDASKKYDKPIATVIELRPNFYPAEEYHQEYAEKNPAHYKSYYRGSGREAYIERNNEK